MLRWSPRRTGRPKPTPTTEGNLINARPERLCVVLVGPMDGCRIAPAHPLTLDGLCVHVLSSFQRTGLCAPDFHQGNLTTLRQDEWPVKALAAPQQNRAESPAWPDRPAPAPRTGPHGSCQAILATFEYIGR